MDINQLMNFIQQFHLVTEELEKIKSQISLVYVKHNKYYSNQIIVFIQLVIIIKIPVWFLLIKIKTRLCKF